MKADDAKRLKDLEKENARLKKLVAEQLLNIDMLKELGREIGEPGPAAQSGYRFAATVPDIRTPCLPRRGPASFRATASAASDVRRRAPAAGAAAGDLSRSSAVGLAQGPRDRCAGRIGGQQEAHSPAVA